MHCCHHHRCCSMWTRLWRWDERSASWNADLSVSCRRHCCSRCLSQRMCTRHHDTHGPHPPIALYRIATFLEFMESGKCWGIWLRSGKRPKVRERSGNWCSRGNLIVAAQKNNLPVLYSYCNSFFIRDVHGDFGLITVHLSDILPAISSEKSWRVVILIVDIFSYCWQH